MIVYCFLSLYTQFRPKGKIGSLTLKRVSGRKVYVTGVVKRQFLNFFSMKKVHGKTRRKTEIAMIFDKID